MCTAIMTGVPEGELYFGRTMDFSYPIDPELYVFSRGYSWQNVLDTHTITSKYQFIGTGQDIGTIALADGVNEMGFAAAVLYFPGYAEYDCVTAGQSSTPSIAAFEIVKFLLGRCKSVEEAASLTRMISIVGIEDSVTNSVAPLHWIIADRSGACAVIEKTAEGLGIYNNPIGVLANSPDFNWHLENLRNYMKVTPEQQQESTWGQVDLTPFGQGAGTWGLPGDYTPPSRFVRAAYHKTHVSIPADPSDAVAACFRILGTVTVPKGAVITHRGVTDYTIYTAVMKLSTQEYYFNTYDNLQIFKAGLGDSYTQGPNVVSLGKLRHPMVFGNV